MSWLAEVVREVDFVVCAALVGLFAGRAVDRDGPAAWDVGMAVLFAGVVGLFWASLLSLT